LLSLLLREAHYVRLLSPVSRSTDFGTSNEALLVLFSRAHRLRTIVITGAPDARIPSLNLASEASTSIMAEPRPIKFGSPRHLVIQTAKNSALLTPLGQHFLLSLPYPRWPGQMLRDNYQVYSPVRALSAAMWWGGDIAASSPRGRHDRCCFVRGNSHVFTSLVQCLVKPRIGYTCDAASYETELGTDPT
jgi:hypothetical protein